ncbi:succinate dehydrogenase, cytochrome b556 subunit [Aquabacterium sp.]|uniref:succinate dehydrogenase, cytochrome b556 subunit n=1 Tax=Aquabacterium sp. TaxID=1872578 RepID=UPI0035B4568B
MAETAKQRPVYRNIHITDIVTYRLPLAGIVSILHRISGAVLFLLLPFVIWMFDTSVTSEISFERFTSVFASGCGGVPAWFIKLVTVGIMWSYLQHFAVGVRHLWMDATHSVSKEQGKSSAVVTLVIALPLTALFAARLFGLY